MIRVSIIAMCALIAAVALATHSLSPGESQHEPADVLEMSLDMQPHPSSVAAAKANRPAISDEGNRAVGTPEIKPTNPNPNRSAKSEPQADEAAVFREHLRGVLESEERDGAWAPVATLAIEKALASHEEIAQLEIDCRASLCQLDLRFAAGKETGADIVAITQAIPWELDGFFQVAPDQTSALLFVTRKDFELPLI